MQFVGFIFCCSEESDIQSSLEDSVSFFLFNTSRLQRKHAQVSYSSYTLTGKAVTLYCHTNGSVYRPASDSVTTLQTKVHKSTVY